MKKRLRLGRGFVVLVTCHCGNPFADEEAIEAAAVHCRPGQRGLRGNPFADEEAIETTALL